MTIICSNIKYNMMLLVGSLLTIIWWVIAWGNFGVLSGLSFFPLWVSYIIAINGLCEWKFNTSLIRQLGPYFLLLFLVSIPMWWFFELMNGIVQNWHYHLLYPLSGIQYAIQASVDFSTVVPSVLSTYFLVKGVIGNIKWSTSRFSMSGGIAAVLGLIGISLFVVIFAFPNEAFPLVWVAPIFIIEPIMYVFNVPSILGFTAMGRLEPVVAIFIGTFWNGIMWEMWNYFSDPKWTYTIPYVGFWKIFEMPVLGYFGYPFFGVIIISYTVLVLSLLGKRGLACVVLGQR